jgi:RNA polymerase sigma-70 factor (ECF subfamily)
MGINGDAAASDAQLIVASLGDPELFGLVFERHATAVYRFLSRRVPASDVEDALVDTFTGAFRSRAKYDPERLIALPWLLGIAVNVARHQHRSASARTRLLGVLGRGHLYDHDLTPEADERLSANADQARVLHALEALDPVLREAVLLAATTDLDYRGMAEVLDVPLGTVRSRLSRGRRRLRASLAPPEESTTPLSGVTCLTEEER